MRRTKSNFLLLIIAACAMLTASLSARTAEEVEPLLIGAAVPSAKVVSQDGKTLDLAEVTKGKPSVIIFYRGGWCPYCNRHLQEVARVEDDLLALGYQIIALSPDSAEELNKLEDKIEVGYKLYSDSHFEAADGFGISFTLPAETLERYKDYDIDLARSSGGANADRLPVSSLFLTTPSGEISFTYVDPNYRYRISSELLLAAAKAGLEFHK